MESLKPAVLLPCCPPGCRSRPHPGHRAGSMSAAWRGLRPVPDPGGAPLRVDSLRAPRPTSSGGPPRRQPAVPLPGASRIATRRRGAGPQSGEARVAAKSARRVARGDRGRAGGTTRRLLIRSRRARPRHILPVARGTESWPGQAPRRRTAHRPRVGRSAASPESVGRTLLAPSADPAASCFRGHPDSRPASRGSRRTCRPRGRPPALAVRQSGGSGARGGLLPVVRSSSKEERNASRPSHSLCGRPAGGAR